MVVGDPDQSIYGWRGAEMSMILNFENDFKGAKVVVLDQNYRSTGHILEGANAAVISVEDVQGSEEIIDEMSASIRVLAVTEGSNGARLYWNGDVRTFRAPAAEEVDPTGAGDIFATGFFYRLHTTRDPWEAARFATQLAANSVTRPGLSGIPTREEINDCKIEILP